MTTRQNLSPGSISLGAIALAFCIACFATIDALNIGVGPAERAAYVVLVGVVIAVFVPALARLDFSRTGWLLIGTWLLFQAIWTIPAVVQRQVYPVYIAGDLAAGLLPILLFAIGRKNPQLFGRAIVLWMTVALLIAVVLAALVSGDAARFEAPASMLTALVWYRVATVRGSLNVFGWLLIAVVILVVAFGSGQRTSLVIWAGGACYALVVGLVSLRIVPVLLSLAALMLLLLAGPMIGESIARVTRGTRHAALASGDADVSVLARLAEADDVIRTFDVEGPASRWLTGLGHGATYEPRVSFLSRNVTEHGRVHNIHIGPLMVWFRYGAMGLAVWLLLVVLAVRSSLSVVRDGDTLRATFGIIVLAGLVEGLVFNVFVDPVFAYGVAGLLFWQKRQVVAG